MFKNLRLFFLAVAFAALFATPAHALYLDPGTGSLVLQVVAAGILTAVVMFKNSWLWLKSVFGKLLRRSENSASVNADGDR